MAEKRMISKVISISEKVNNLPDFDALLYTWMIPHSDDFGRLEGSPGTVRALVMPRRNSTDEDVRSALQRMAEVELILWYKSNNKMVIQINNFEDHQQGLHKRTRSKLPDPPEDSESYFHLPRNSGNFPTFPPEEKGREGKRTEQKGIGTEGKGTGDADSLSPDSNPHKDSILKLIQECKVDKCDLYSLDIIYSFIGAVDIEVIEAAIKKSSSKHINYAINTLKNWAAEGKTTLEQINPPAKVAPFKGRSDKPYIPIVEQQPVKEVPEDVYSEALALANKLKADREAKERVNRETA